MITKVVLGVALVLIEFSFITSSQNSSLGSNYDTSTPTKFSSTSNFDTTAQNAEVTSTKAIESKEYQESFDGTSANFSSTTDFDTTTKLLDKTSPIAVHLAVSNDTSTTASSSSSSAFTTTKSVDNPLATTAAPSPTDDPSGFSLPENCAAYKVSAV